jgi:hypothetical protein
VEQAVLPLIEECVPAAHSSQVVDRLSTLNRPAAQASQAENPSSENVPARQVSHALAPDSENRPPPHERHRSEAWGE